MTEIIEKPHKNPITPHVAEKTIELLKRQLASCKANQIPRLFPAQGKLLETLVLDELKLKTLHVYGFAMAIAVSLGLVHGTDDEIEYWTGEITEHHASFADQKSAVGLFFTRRHISMASQELIFAEDEQLRTYANGDTVLSRARDFLQGLLI